MATATHTSIVHHTELLRRPRSVKEVARTTQTNPKRASRELPKLVCNKILSQKHKTQRLYMPKGSIGRHVMQAWRWLQNTKPDGQEADDTLPGRTRESLPGSERH